MFNFDGTRPTKQGTKYGINLGQNDGPYLVKDMMMNNTKSLQMLTGSMITGGSRTASRSVIQSVMATQSSARRELLGSQAPKIYDEQLGTYTNYDETNKNQLTASESLGINSTVQHTQIKKMRELLQQYKDVIHEYKEELKGMNKRINDANHDSTAEFQPALRMFHEDLKQQLQETKNENYQLQREIDQLNRDKTQIQQQIAFSEKRIQDLEKFMGVSAKLDESDESDGLDFQ